MIIFSPSDDSGIFSVTYTAVFKKHMLYYQADYRTLYLKFKQLKDSFIPKYLKIMLFPTCIIFVTQMLGTDRP